MGHFLIIYKDTYVCGLTILIEIPYFYLFTSIGEWSKQEKKHLCKQRMASYGFFTPHLLVWSSSVFQQQIRIIMYSPIAIAETAPSILSFASLACFHLTRLFFVPLSTIYYALATRYHVCCCRRKRSVRHGTTVMRYAQSQSNLKYYFYFHICLTFCPWSITS